MALVDDFIADLRGDSEVVFDPVTVVNFLTKGSPLSSPEDT